ncbi:hypothetical protein [Polyangium fumosum]|uniref:Copper type II ascorbate-dependent monooxygenase C-terminal domain-containing protein n=1 Tax=Polyangium fumosum TaxID=889272 RepID=A0A4U1IUZ3_9BACT|nr:hypothetical protein [Polyangium fumosum]TKC97918.1 hypothetical protein E8A74_43280 [Polyangium fumosum]
MMKRHSFAIPSLLTLACFAGCGDTTEDPRGTPITTGPTYYKDIAPLVAEQCAGCHQEGRIGQFSLLDASMAAQMAQAMAAATKARTMPPMPVNNDGSCNTYKNARWLSDEEISLFERWASAGAPLGDVADAPPPPVDDKPKMTGEVAGFDLGVDYTPHPADDQPDDYRCFIVDPGLATDAFITGYDIQPGDARVVHHVALFALPNAEIEAGAAALDAAEEGPGYTCFGGPGVPASVLGAWAPGTGATLFPAGTGIRYVGGRKLVVQMHYNVPATGGPFTDRSTMKLQISKDPGLTPARFQPILTTQMSLPPGNAHVEATAEVPLSALAQKLNLPPFEGFRLWGMLPHMHLAGRTLRSEATAPGGASQCLMDVDRWDFHWQDVWWNETPIDISVESTIRLRCGYDTRGRVQPTVYGEGTNDEMCLGVLYVTMY